MDKTEIEQRTKKVMEKVINVDAKSINDSTSSETVKRWDSLRHMHLILALEEEFGVEFTDEQIPKMLNFKVIVQNISEKLG